MSKTEASTELQERFELYQIGDLVYPHREFDMCVGSDQYIKAKRYLPTGTGIILEKYIEPILVKDNEEYRNYILKILFVDQVIETHFDWWTLDPNERYEAE